MNDDALIYRFSETFISYFCFVITEKNVEFSREAQENASISVEYLSTNETIADVLTKSLSMC